MYFVVKILKNGGIKMKKVTLIMGLFLFLGSFSLHSAAASELITVTDAENADELLV